MNILGILDMLCDITTKQSDLLRELVTELEHMKQVSEEVKDYYRERFDEIEGMLDIAEYRSRNIPNMEDAFEEGIEKESE